MSTCETHPSTLTAEYRQGQARCGYCGHDQCRLWRLWSRAVPSVETRGDCGNELCSLFAAHWLGLRGAHGPFTPYLSLFRLEVKS